MAEIENSKAPGTGLFIHHLRRRFEVVAVDECLVYATDERGELFIDSSRNWTDHSPMPPGAAGRAAKVKGLMPLVGEKFGDAFKHRLPPEYVEDVLALGKEQRNFIIEASRERDRELERLCSEVRLKEPILVVFGEGGRVLSATYPTPAPQRS